MKKTFLAVLLALTASAYSQLVFDNASKDADTDRPPTVITADAMDINLARNKILLMGNVHVVDPKLDLKCRRMILFLKTIAPPPVNPGEKAPKGKKDLERIECYEDVVIIRKEKSEDGDEQRSESGKAVYLVENGSVTLTVEPVLYKGDKSEVRGSKIILYMDSDRMELFDGKVTTKEIKSMSGKGVQ